MSFTTYKTWTAVVVSVGDLNQQIRDNGNILKTEISDLGIVTRMQAFRGLQLRTHPDADIAAKTIWAKADQVVMDDGQILAFTTPVVADLTVAGAGGLDAGSEGASRWYEVYAIAKEDGTKSGLLHRAKNYSVDTSFVTARDASRALRRATSTATDKLAQGIQFANAGPLQYVDVEVVRAGSVVGNIWFSLQSSSGGDASAVLATSDKLDASLISTSNQIIRLVFRVPFSESASTQYHLVLEGDYTRSDTVNIAWRGVAAGGYGSGVAREYNGAAWANASGVGDFYFQAAITLNDTTVTMPTGYTKKCLIGYAYNDGSSNLFGFVARDRTVKFMSLSATDAALILVNGGTATIPTLVDTSTKVPPGLVTPILTVQNGTGASTIIVAPVPNGFASSGQTGNAGAVRLDVPGTGVTPLSDMTATEYQGLYASVTSGTLFLSVVGFTW